MRLTQEQVDNAPALNNWLSDGDGLLLRTTHLGGRAWYWHRRVDGKAKRTKIGNAKTMPLIEARAHVRRGGAPASTEAQVKALEAENLVLETRLEETRAERDRLWEHNLRMVGQLNALVDTMRGLGLQPQRMTKVQFQQDGTVVDSDPEAVERQSVPFETLLGRWFDLREPDWSPGSVASYRSRMGSVRERFGQRSADQISPREIADFLNGASSRSVRDSWGFILRGAFGLAVAEGHMQTNPAETAKPLLRNGGNGTKHREALAVEDLPAYFATLGDTKAEQALRLVILTAVRVGAVTGGSVDEVEGDVWTVPESRQSKGKRTPRVPMTPAALACVDGFGAAGTAIRKVIAGRSFTVHGFRSTFRQWCQRCENADISFEAKETALGHAVGTAVQRAYERDDLLAERRTLMERWAAYCTAGGD